MELFLDLGVMFMKKENELRRDVSAIKKVLIGLFVLVLFGLFKVLSSLVVPLVLALFVACLLYGPLDWIVNFRWSKKSKTNCLSERKRTALYFFSMLTIVAIVGVVSLSVCNVFTKSFTGFVEDYNNPKKGEKSLASSFEAELESIKTAFSNCNESCSAIGLDISLPSPKEFSVKEIFSSNFFKKFTTTVFGFSGMFCMTLLYLVFILSGNILKCDRYLDYLEDDKDGSRDALNDAVRDVRQSISKYMLIKSGLSLLTGFMYWLICTCFNVPYAFVWGVLAFVLNFIPYIGSLLASIFPVIVGVVLIESPAGDVGFLACLFGTQIIVGSVIEPRVMGDSFSLNTVVILFSLVLFTYLWGGVGTILTIPLLVLIKLILNEIDENSFIVRLMGSPPKEDKK